MGKYLERVLQQRRNLGRDYVFGTRTKQAGDVSGSGKSQWGMRREPYHTWKTYTETTA